MPPPPDPSKSPGGAAIQARIELALRELSISQAHLAAVAPQIAASLLLRGDSPPGLNSSLFDFRRKVVAVVEHFTGAGLTLPVYLRAALRQPSLFYQSPATIIGNVEGVAKHFKPHGLALPAYLRAIRRQPQLFYQSPTTITSNIEGIVNHFAGHGLTLPAYLRAALRQPSLFTLLPTTVIANIVTVAEHFQPHGLTLPAYLGAALRQPSLFYQAPATVIAKIEAVAEHFVPQGLALQDYLQAAVKHPSLFYQLPGTIIRHVNTLISMYQEGLLTLPGDRAAPPDQPMKPLFRFLMKHPARLTQADDNYALRATYARRFPNRLGAIALLCRPRQQLEQELALSLGKACPPGKGKKLIIDTKESHLGRIESIDQETPS